jgi:hypothetical protein
MIPSSVNEQLLALVSFTVEHALASIEQGAPLIPFLISEKDGERLLGRFFTGRLEDSVEELVRNAQATISSVDRLALAFDGYVTSDGLKAEAIVVRATESSEGLSHNFGQRYTRSARDLRTVRLGELMFLGSERTSELAPRGTATQD